ncbi:uncharacterized protein [Dermacentor albipictus]|uniref:uncharacterized protein n=1 Tax=Dermacentor albipictus TaxID=60249 RepID=UPI0038FD1551
MSSPSSSSSSSFSSSSGDDFLHEGVAAVLDVANHFRFDPLESSDSDIAAGDGEHVTQETHAETMPTPSHSNSLIQTPQAKRPWRQMQAASTPRTATLTAGVSP